MKITLEMLEEMNACEPIKQAFVHTFGTEAELRDVVKWAIDNGRTEKDHALWLLPWFMDAEQRAAYALNAAKRVLPIFERACPSESGPREAIEAAENFLGNRPSDFSVSREKYDRYRIRATFFNTDWAFAASAALGLCYPTFAAMRARDVVVYALTAFFLSDLPDGERDEIYGNVQREFLEFGLKLLDE